MCRVLRRLAAAVPFRPVEPTTSNRESSALFVDLAALVGLAGIVAGVLVLGPTDLCFDRAAAVSALFAWIPVTLPAALVILAASAVNVGAGVVLARAVSTGVSTVHGCVSGPARARRQADHRTA